MAKVYTIEELQTIVLDKISRLNALYGSLIAARSQREAMYDRGESLTAINTTLTAVLADLETIADAVGGELTAMIWTNAIEVRIGVERKLDRFDVDLPSGEILTHDEDGAPIAVMGSLFVNFNVVEVVDPEDAANARLLTLTSGPTSTQLQFATVSGGVDNETDTKAKIILRDDATS